ISDDARAEKGRSMFVIEDAGNGITEVSWCDSVFGVAAVGVVSSETGVRAQVLESVETEFANTVRGVEPGDSDAVSFFMTDDGWAAGIDGADDLMSGNHRALVRRNVALDGVQIGVA